MSEFREVPPLPEARESESVTPANLLEDFDGALAAIASIEGQFWMGQINDNHGHPSADQSNLPWGVRDALMSGSPPNVGIINGLAGNRRYYVSPDGTVKISSRHTMDEETLAKAKALGIDEWK
ncbi:hypothetical protein HON52_00620 [Candidatus Uhrbacteria bacterium]|jgi:hypothetical protein|nr:hypothetical protein [Candidatus Uhrbacteria bacterium]